MYSLIQCYRNCRYYLTSLELDGVMSVIMYFTYMAGVSVVLFLITGTIGFFAALWFNRIIYSCIKVD